MFKKKEYMKQYRKDNKEKIIEANKQWQKTNSEYIKEYYQKNRGKIIAYNKKRYQDNKERSNEQSREWRRENLEKIKARRKLYRIKAKEKIKEYNREWGRKKRRTDLKYNLRRKMSGAIYRSLKDNKAGRHWEDLIDYTLIDLIKRLKFTMPKGCTWQDFIEGKLHIDHIIPVSVFNFDRPGHLDFKRCYALGNLQLLPAKENLKKSNKLYKSFQPSLAI